MSQFITVQVGQCGNQIGSAFWPLALHEYGVQTNYGGVNLLKIQRNYMRNITDLSDAFHSFFYIPENADSSSFKTIADLSAANVKARAVLIDMEDSVVSRLKRSSIRGIFDQTCSVTNYPGSANNWAMGYHTHGTDYRDRLEDVIRLTVEKCDQLHGFLFMHSVGGGTGSGLGTATLKMLYDDYPCISRLVSCVYPLGTEDVITAPYNVLLATRELIEHATCVFPVENKALLEICNAQMIQNNFDQFTYNILSKPFQDMNSIIVNVLLHLTSGSRFPGSLNVDASDIATNLVPYPKLHYIFSSVSPLALTAPKIYMAQTKKLKDELFTAAWSQKNQLMKVYSLQPGSRILSAAHMTRGNFSLCDLKRNIEKFQSKAKFTSWSKETMKIGMCSIPPAGHEASLLCLINSSAMSLMFKHMIHQFTRLYRRKAHVHHYTKIDGFDEGDFDDSKEAILNLCEQYKAIQAQQIDNTPRLQVI